MIDGARTGGPTAGPSFRPVRATELADCAAIWRASINDYIVHLGQTEIPPEMAPIVRLYTHLQATDPDRFIVATLPDGSGDRVIGFAAATVREHLWYLSMLFVLPEFQGVGSGPRAAGPGRRRPTARWSARSRRTAPSRSPTRCTPARGWSRGCRCSA